MTTVKKKRTTAKGKTRKTTTRKRKVAKTTKRRKTKAEPMDGTKAKRTGIKKVIRSIKSQLKDLEKKVG